MKNKLIDLNDHLFAQLEKLGDDALTGENLDTEIKRSKAVAQVAGQIIAGMSLALDAQKALGDGLVKALPETLSMNRKASIPDKSNGQTKSLQ